jgi:hypothetical protein
MLYPTSLVNFDNLVSLPPALMQCTPIFTVHEQLQQELWHGVLNVELGSYLGAAPDNVKELKLILPNRIPSSSQSL